MIFAIVSFTSSNKPLADALAQDYPNNFFQADDEMRLFFVSDAGTAKDVSDQTGITAGAFGFGHRASGLGLFRQSTYQYLGMARVNNRKPFPVKVVEHGGS